MTLTRIPTTRTSVRAVIAAASVALWLVGSALTPAAAISEGSSLAWKAKPATASVHDVITSAVGDPTGPKVKVVLYNGSGVQERIAGIPIELHIVSGEQCLRAGTWKADTNDNGVATFEPIIDCAGFDYQVQAFAADGASQNSGHIAETPPATFDIRTGDVTGCSGTCTDSASVDGNTQVQITTTASGYLVLDLETDTLTCENYTTSSQVVVFDVVGGTSRTTVTITLDASQVTRAFKKYEVCLNKSNEVFQLPDCPKTLDGAPSCVVSLKKEKDGDVRVTISVEPGDPRVAL